MCLCLHIVCWLVFGGRLYTSENKGNVYNYSGFHLVDALSWLHTWTGVVGYKMYVPSRTSSWSRRRRWRAEGRMQGFLEGFTGLGGQL